MKTIAGHIVDKTILCLASTAGKSLWDAGLLFDDMHIGHPLGQLAPHVLLIKVMGRSLQKYMLLSDKFK